MRKIPHGDDDSKGAFEASRNVRCTDPESPVGDTPHRDAGWKIHSKGEGIKLSNGFSKRVPDRLRHWVVCMTTTLCRTEF